MLGYFGGEAYAGFEVAGADDDVFCAWEGAHDGLVFPDVGAEAGPGAGDAGVGEVGEEGLGAGEEGVGGVGGGGGVEAGFGFGGGADQGAVAPGDDVGFLVADDHERHGGYGRHRGGGGRDGGVGWVVAGEGGVVGEGDFDGLSFGRAGGDAGGDAGVEEVGPGAGGEEEDIARDVAGVGDDGGAAVLVEAEGLDGGMGADGDAGAGAGLGEGGDEGGDVDLSGDVGEEGAEVGGADLGEAGADVGGFEVGEGLGVAEAGPVGGGGGDVIDGLLAGLGVGEEFEVAVAVEGDGEAGGGLEFVDEGFEGPERVALEGLEGSFEGGPGGPEGAEGGEGSAGAWGGAFEEGDLGVGGQSPGAGQADDAAADDDNVFVHGGAL